MTRHHIGRSLCALALPAMLAVLAAPAPAAAQEDTSLTESLLSTLGLVAPTPPDIEYRERAPLVVPQSTDILPPPRVGDDLADNPAWPKDDDQQRRQAEKAAALGITKMNSKQGGVDPRKLTPAELDRGYAAGRKTTSRDSAPGRGTSKDGRLSVKDMDFLGWGNKKDLDKVEFAGEPERTNLTQPPAGYQTPAPNAAYGSVEEKKQPWSLGSWFNRTQTNKQ